jgi:hypothetical protein
MLLIASVVIEGGDCVHIGSSARRKVPPPADPTPYGGQGAKRGILRHLCGMMPAASQHPAARSARYAVLRPLGEQRAGLWTVRC